VKEATLQNRLDPIDRVPRAIVYTLLEGMRKTTVRHQ